MSLLCFPPSSGSGFHGKDAQACRVDQDNRCGGCLLCPGLRQMEREGAQGWLVAEPIALLYLKHQVPLPTVIAHRDRAERRLQGKAAVKYCLSPLCHHWAEWPCRPELCVVLGARTKPTDWEKLPQISACGSLSTNAFLT